MERAIDVMRSSVGEQRFDGRPNPLVGALLVRTDGSVETAARGELRDGNHAEFTLLERKCSGERLDGSVLFATLEPCLHRNHPKRGCAKHIVSARIKEVWVGIEDDNPTVAGKGIEYLRRHGVEVHMFDRDLQDTIISENKEFFEWARKQVALSAPEPITLSKYEGPLSSVELDDLADDALELYRTRAGLNAAHDSLAFTRLLQQQGILVGDGKAAKPSGFGLLLFGKAPRNAVAQAGLLARAELPDGTSAREEFGQALVLVPERVEAWLKTVLPSTINRNQMQRRESVALPFEMIREAVVNALIHRDYDLIGQKCHLVVNADTIVIKSPGGPIPPITLEQLRSFNAPMKSRNPILHYVFARMGMAEEQGFGLLSLRDESKRLGLPLPTFSMVGDSLELTIFRSSNAAVTALQLPVQEALNDDEKAAWKFISGQQSVTRADLMNRLAFDERKAQRVLKKLRDFALITQIGGGRSTRYQRSDS